MALDSYSGLKTTIAELLERDDLTDHIDDFIDLAEARHQRDIRIRDMLTRAPLTIGARYVSVPSGYLQAETLRILTDANSNDLGCFVVEHVNLDKMNRIRRTTTGQPTNFTVHAEIEFDRTPDQNYGGEIIYYAPLTALSDSNTTNALLTRAPDAYLYGALLASAPFLLHDERISVWAELYTSTRDRLNALDRRARHTGPLFSRPTGILP